MKSPLVYLCGTITPDDKHLEWRRRAENMLGAAGIGVLSPIRGKDPKDWTKDGLEGRHDLPYANGGFVGRDRRDVLRSDALLLYFTKETAPARQSLGTWIEMGWATDRGIPVVVVSDMPEIVNHPFIYRLADRVFTILDKACEYLRFYFYEEGGASWVEQAAERVVRDSAGLLGRRRLPQY